MLAQQLEAFNAFMGNRKEENHESTFFLRIDRWLLSQCGSSWDSPQTVRYLLENKAARRQIADYINRYLLRTAGVISYLGLNKYLRYKTPFNLDCTWGWKCPLSTFTLPIWLDIFPGAKVIHILRHGVDVANSLRQRGRREANPERFRGAYYKFPIVHALRPKSGEFIRVRCESLEGGFSLWEEYCAAARDHVAALNGQALELKYETLLSSPERVLENVLRFCDIDVDPTKMQQAMATVKTDRAYAYRSTPELQAFAETVAPQLKHYGY
jgi:Sulfotransferase family